MQPENERRPLNLRVLLAGTGLPVAVSSYPPNIVLFRQGDPCDTVMFVEEGLVRLGVMSTAGQEVVCGLAKQGAFLGDEALSGHAVRRETATAMSETKVLVVPKVQMIQALHTRNTISDRFIAYTLARNAQLEADLADQLLHSSEQRLARTLLVLAGCDAIRPCLGVLPPVSQEILAEMVGTTRSRVNTFIGRFRRRGFIEWDGRRLHVTPALQQFVEHGPPPRLHSEERPRLSRGAREHLAHLLRRTGHQ